MPCSVFRSFNRAIGIAAFVAVLSTAASGQLSSPIRLEGAVYVELEEGYTRPVEGALVEVYRLDVNGYWNTRTDRSGHYSILGLSFLGTYLIVASGPHMQPIWVNKHPLKAAHRIDFVAMPGGGKRLALEEVKAFIGLGRSRQVEIRSDRDQILKVKAAYSKAERRRAHLEIEKFEREMKRAEALQADFDRARDHYNQGVRFLDSKWYQAALKEFEQAAAIDASRHPAFAKLAYNALASIAEIPYRNGFDYLALKQLYGGKPHFLKSVEVITKAIELASTATNPNAPDDLLIYYRILAKNIRILAGSCGELDHIDRALSAFGKGEFVDKRSAGMWAAMKGDLFRLGKRPAEALATYRKSLADDPDNLDALYGISLIHIKSSDKQERQHAATYMDDFLRKAPATDDRVASMRALRGNIKR